MNEVIKKFDCVQMKRTGAAKVARRILGMTRKEELAFWAEGTRKLVASQKKMKAKAVKTGRT